ncbi:MAG: hypothetical protein JO180_04445 [Gemmatirosa sp.]|nr:hypothetical protein [Gemmatirosa sp.]
MITMTRFARRTTLASLLAAASLATPLAAQDVGLTLTTQSTVTATGPMAGLSQAMGGTTRIQTNGRSSRLEYTDTLPHAPFGVGAVVLTIDTARTVVLVPARREYYTFDVSKMMATVAEMQRASGMTTRITESDVHTEHVGPGETLLGEPTDRWRLAMRMGMAMAMPGMDMTIRMESTTDTWYGRTATVATPSVGPGAAPSPFVPPEVQAKMMAALRELPVGTPMRKVVTTITYNGDQEMGRSTVTTDVTSMVRGPIPASTFAIPADYREVPAPPLPGMPARTP